MSIILVSVATVLFVLDQEENGSKDGLLRGKTKFMRLITLPMSIFFSGRPSLKRRNVRKIWGILPKPEKSIVMQIRVVDGK